MSAQIHTTDYAAPNPSITITPTTLSDLTTADAINESKGAIVHHFDPNASPAEKAAAARKGASELAPLNGLSPKNEFKAAGGSSLVSDVGGTGGEGIPLTTSSKEVLKLADDKKKSEKNEINAEDEENEMIGGLPKDGPIGFLLNQPPNWFSKGWEHSTIMSKEDFVERSLLADYVSDMWYGSWYHNGGIIIFSVLATHFITLFGGGWGWMIIILAFCATYYDTSITRTRRNVRDDLTREVAKKGLVTDLESAMWINNFMDRFWLIYQPVLSATIVGVVDQVLSVSTPSFLDSLALTDFTLGSKPPRIDHVRTYADTADDVIMMDMKVSFTPNDLLQMTYAAAAKKINPRIVLTIRIGAGIASVGKDIVVEDIMFQGTLRFKFQLMNPFPHVKTVSFMFLEQPTFDFVPRPIGFDMSIIPGFKSFVMGQIHGSLSPMMYNPNPYTIDLEQILSGAPTDTAVGVLALTVYNGRGLKATKLGGGSPDPYISFSVAGRGELDKTEIKRNTSTPQWNKTFYFLLNNLTDPLSMTVMDWNEHRPDSSLGSVTFDVTTLAEDGQQEGLLENVMLDAKPRGVVKFDATYYPVLKGKTPDEILPETTSGVVRLTVHQAKDLDPRGQQINPYYNVTLNRKKAFRSTTLKRTPNPIWEKSTELLITDRKSAVIGVQILDDNTIQSDGPLGNISIKLEDILETTKKGEHEYPLSGVKSGRIFLTAVWKPVLMSGAINGSGAYTPPIGVVRILFKRAKDLKNVEALTGGKSDPYARVLHAGIVVARTLVIDNNLNPEWDEIVYIPVHSPKDRYIVEVMDYQHVTKDRTLGIADLNVADLLTQGTDKKNKPWLSTGKHSRNEMLRSDGRKTVKGSIEFDVDFFPCAHLKNVVFNEPATETIREVAEEKPAVTAPSDPLKPATNGATKTKDNDDDEEEEDPNAGIIIPRSELLKAQSGILAFQIVEGRLPRKGVRVEVLFDDGYWPAYSTEPARSPHAIFDEIGEAFIRELDYSRIIIKLNAADKDTREDIIAMTSLDMNHFLETCLDKPMVFTLTHPAGGLDAARSTVHIAAKYIPVEIQLDPRESVNNSGDLRVEILDAVGIRGADRSGKSDPFVELDLNGTSVFKTKVIKKTLTPVWNETAESIPVFSRVSAKFYVEVYDWDRVGSATLLGRGRVDLASLEPFEKSEVSVVLSDEKTGKEHGTVRINLLFKPRFVSRSRQATSGFGTAGRVATSLGGGVIGVGTGIVGGGVGAVGAVGSTVGKGLAKGLGFRRSSVHVASSSTGSNPPIPPLPTNINEEVILPPTPSATTGSGDLSPTLPPSATGSGGSSYVGTLSVMIGTLTNAGDADEKKAVSLRLNGKAVDTTHAHKGDPIAFDQSFTLKTTDGPCTLDFTVLHKKTIGKDIALGNGTISVWDHLSPLSAPTTSIQIEAAGGQLSVTLSWTASTSFPTPLDDSRSINGSVSPSQRTKSRFSSSRFSRNRGETPPVE